MRSGTPIFIAVAGVATFGLLASRSASSQPIDPPFDHLACYRIQDANAGEKYTVDLTPAQSEFLAETGCVLKGQARSLCIDVRKTNVDPLPPLDIEGQEAQSYLCYRLRCPKKARGRRDGAGKPQDEQASLLMEDQFGDRDVVAGGSPFRLCAPARRVGEPPRATATPCAPANEATPTVSRTASPAPTSTPLPPTPTFTLLPPTPTFTLLPPTPTFTPLPPTPTTTPLPVETGRQESAVRGPQETACDGPVVGTSVVTDLGTSGTKVEVTLTQGPANADLKLTWTCTKVANGCHADSCGFTDLGQITTNGSGEGALVTVLPAGNPFPGYTLHLDLCPAQGCAANAIFTSTFSLVPSGAASATSAANGRERRLDPTR